MLNGIAAFSDCEVFLRSCGGGDAAHDNRSVSEINKGQGQRQEEQKCSGELVQHSVRGGEWLSVDEA